MASFLIFVTTFKITKLASNILFSGEATAKLLTVLVYAN